MPISAISFGAKIIEVHAKLKKIDKGPDGTSSLTINEIKKLCSFRDDLYLLQKNSINKNNLSTDLIKIKNFRKKPFFKNDMDKGSKISLNDLTFRSPERGLIRIKLICYRKKNYLDLSHLK